MVDGGTGRRRHGTDRLGRWNATIEMSTSSTQRCLHNQYEEFVMTEGVKTIIYPGTDLAKAKTLYSRLLGVPPEMDEPYYVGWNVKGQDVRLDPHG